MLPSPRSPGPSPGVSPVVSLSAWESDTALVQGVREGRKDASSALFDRYSPLVERVLVRVLGPDPEIADLLQDVFVLALGSIHKLEKASALRAWLVQIAVFTARGRIRRRVRWRFISLLPPEQMPEVEAEPPSAELSQAVRRTYAVMGKLAPDERIAFALRFIEGMELTEVAAACGASLATIKRRLSRAQRRFCELAQAEPALAGWVGGAS